MFFFIVGRKCPFLIERVQLLFVQHLCYSNRGRGMWPWQNNHIAGRRQCCFFFSAFGPTDDDRGMLTQRLLHTGMIKRFHVLFRSEKWCTSETYHFGGEMINNK